MVSATIEFEGQTELAVYASEDPETDIFASGTVDPDPNQSGDESVGTSFASPAVAATMARLHAENPTLTSQQIQAELLQSESHLVSGQATLNEGPINSPEASVADNAETNRLLNLFALTSQNDVRSRFLDVFGT